MQDKNSISSGIILPDVANPDATDLDALSPEDIGHDTVDHVAFDRKLIDLIAPGLPLTHRPYADIASQLGSSEQEVVARIERLYASGCIKRYGVVVRHHELGYTANGMVVWDIPDERVAELGHCIGQFECVTLSYRRPRRLPQWPYNLFTMVHGRSRIQVLQRVDEIVRHCSLQDISKDILFSTHRFKQRGACYQRPVRAGART